MVVKDAAGEYVFKCDKCPNIAPAGDGRNMNEMAQKAGWIRCGLTLCPDCRKRRGM